MTKVIRMRDRVLIIIRRAKHAPAQMFNKGHTLWWQQINNHIEENRFLRNNCVKNI